MSRLNPWRISIRPWPQIQNRVPQRPHHRHTATAASIAATSCLNQICTYLVYTALIALIICRTLERSIKSKYRQTDPRRLTPNNPSRSSMISAHISKNQDAMRLIGSEKALLLHKALNSISRETRSTRPSRRTPLDQPLPFFR